MLSRRGMFLSLLSIFCIATFSYYTVIPQGPRLLNWGSSSAFETQDEMEELTSAFEVMQKADKFTPECGSEHGRFSLKQFV